MIIIGIDPGSYKTGWGVIDASGSVLKHLGSGVIQAQKNQSLSLRLEAIYNNLKEVTERFQPEEGAIEEVFTCKNARSALVLGHARGVAVLSLKNGGCRHVYQYAARKIKMSVVGVGSADKRQIQHMVKVILALKKSFASEDESDALASAICHANSRGVFAGNRKEI